MKEDIDQSNLPQHIAVIMDGNGRWAKQQGAARIFGHRSAIRAVREVTELVHTIRGEIKTLMDNNVRLSTIGHTETLPADCQRELAEAMRETAGNTGLTLILALSYSGRWEIIEAARQLAVDVRDGKIGPADIDEQRFSSYLTTANIPDPELMIRTSGEMRISNFMLWQLAYSEFYMPEVLWPDFRRKHLHEAILTYQQRERRFGKTSEQVSK
jgi:undecaprenyl diphosphate synthase